MSENHLEALKAGFAERRAVIGVVGLGYVGLPLVRTIAEAGFATIGFDTDQGKVDTLLAGRSYIHHLPADLLAETLLKEEPRPGQAGFYPTSDFSLVAKADAILICVPTPLDSAREPDLSYVEDTAATLAKHQRAGQLIVLESTTYPGTTEEILRPILEASGHVCGVDLFLAFSPEREDPNNPDFSTKTIPKLVGGVTPACGEVAHDLYDAFIETVIPVSSASVAEAAKLLENIYRGVNIALVNELKVLLDRMGIDVWEVVAAASTKPFGFTPFYPGPGLGGHCIPIDPFYLTWRARQFGLTTRFIELAGEVNQSMPAYVISKIADALNDESKSIRASKILLLGVAYKANLDDTRESPALEILDLLIDRGADVDYHDPYVPELLPSRRHDFGLRSVAISEGNCLQNYDLVLIATRHEVVDYQRIVDEAALVVDTRNATSGLRQGRARIVKA